MPLNDVPPLPDAAPRNDRGFLVYGGGPVETDYGHEVRIQESSAASGPKVWMFISDSPIAEGHDPHLSLVDAIEIRDRLTQFIDGVAERWTNGERFLEEACRIITERRKPEEEIEKR